MPVLRAEQLAAWSGGRWEGTPPSVVTGVCADTRELAAGELFVALKGRRDGHDFIPDAFARGAAAVMAEEGHPVVGPVLRVDSTRAALTRLAGHYRKTLRGRVIGITGSVGKTTVKELVAEVLGVGEATCRTVGNWNNDIGLPLSLLRMEPHHRYGVFELGTNHPGEIAALSAILQPEWGIVTAIGPAHLEFLGSLEGVTREKSALLRALPEHGLAVLPSDDDWFPQLRAATPCRVVTIATRAEADYRGEASPGTPNHFCVIEAKTGERAQLPLPGGVGHMIRNALFAVAIGRAVGRSWDAIAEGLLRFRPQPFRWNVEEVAGVVIVNDAYNANPMSMRAALEDFAQMPVKGRRWLVLGTMRELGAECEEMHRSVGRALAKGPWAGLVAVGEGGAWIAEGAQSAGWPAERTWRCPAAEDAAAWLAERLASGDAVLLKASRAERLERVADELRRLWGHSKPNEG